MFPVKYWGNGEDSPAATKIEAPLGRERLKSAKFSPGPPGGARGECWLINISTHFCRLLRHKRRLFLTRISRCHTGRKRLQTDVAIRQRAARKPPSRRIVRSGRDRRGSQRRGRRCPKPMPRIPALCRSAASVRFILFAITGSGVRAFECAWSSRTSRVVQAMRLVSLCAIPDAPVGGCRDRPRKLQKSLHLMRSSAGATWRV